MPASSAGCSERISTFQSFFWHGGEQYVALWQREHDLCGVLGVGGGMWQVAQATVAQGQFAVGVGPSLVPVVGHMQNGQAEFRAQGFDALQEALAQFLVEGAEGFIEQQ